MKKILLKIWDIFNDSDEPCSEKGKMFESVGIIVIAIIFVFAIASRGFPDSTSDFLGNSSTLDAVQEDVMTHYSQY